MAIQMFNLGPPAVDTFSMIGNLGKSFFDAYDAQRRRAAEDRKWKAEDEADKINADYAKSLTAGLGAPDPSNTPLQPSRSVSEVGKVPSFALTNGGMHYDPKLVENRQFVSSPDHAATIDEYLEGNAKAQGFGNLDFRKRLLAFLNDNPYGIGVGSMDRDTTQQAKLYKDYIGSGKRGAPVAPPGRSNHNHGVAADMSYEDAKAREWAHANAARYGLRFPMSYEPWHVEPVEARGGALRRTQVASVAPGAGFTPDTAPSAVPVPTPRPADVGASPVPAFAPVSVNPTFTPMNPAMTGVTMAAGQQYRNTPPAMPAPAPQAAPVPAPAPPPAPAPVQMAQAAPAAPVASDARTGDPIMDVLRRLPPQQQQWYVRALSNRITAPAAMQRLQSMVRQNEYSFSNAPDGSLVRTNKATGAVERVPGYEKPQDRWQYQEQPNGDLIGTNAATGKREVLNAGERDAVIRQYQFAQRQGYQGTLFDFKRGMAEASRPVTNVTTNLPAGETDYQKEVGKDRAKRESAILDAGEAADKMLVDLSQLRQLSAQIGAPGKMADTLLKLGPYAQALGIDISGLSDLQAYNAILKRVAPQQRVAGSGSTSDIEYKGMLEGLGTASNDPRAREMIFDTIESVARYDQARRDIVQKLRDGEITKEQAKAAQNALGDPMSNFRKFKAENPQLFPKARPKLGSVKIPTEAVADLRKMRDTPENRALFDDVFGEGAASRVLGRPK